MLLLPDELVPELELVVPEPVELEPEPVPDVPAPEPVPGEEDPSLVVFMVEPLPEVPLLVPPFVPPVLVLPVPAEPPVPVELPVAVPVPLVVPSPVRVGSVVRPVPVPLELVAAGVGVADPTSAPPPVPDGGDWRSLCLAAVRRATSGRTFAGGVLTASVAAAADAKLVVAA